ncbi:MAG: hypothetical protein JKY37_05565 [Nannocystaceae bacterium]|nr:hypothetical protein [Nannocystaceae bacterium]
MPTLLILRNRFPAKDAVRSVHPLCPGSGFPVPSSVAPPPHSLRLALIFALSCVVACDRDPADTGNEDEDIQDHLVYESTHRTLATVPLLAYVAELFRADVAWKSLTPEVGAQVAVRATQARIEFVLGAFQCEREFESDGATFLRGSFSNCQLADFSLEGDFRAELTIETGPCPLREGDCAAAVLWTLATPTFLVGKNNETGTSHFTGPVALRDSIVDPDEPMTWETKSGFSLEAAHGEKFETRSTASWKVDSETNCMDISLDARLEAPETGDEPARMVDVGEIVISATDVHYCLTHCPTKGRIEMAFGLGSILSWQYDGSDEVVVTGPGGREFVADLPCPPAP